MFFFINTLKAPTERITCSIALKTFAILLVTFRMCTVAKVSWWNFFSIQETFLRFFEYNIWNWRICVFFIWFFLDLLYLFNDGIFYKITVDFFEIFLIFTIYTLANFAVAFFSVCETFTVFLLTFWFFACAFVSF